MSILELKVDALLRLCAAEDPQEQKMLRKELLELMKTRWQTSIDPEYLVRQILLERCGEDMKDDVRQSLLRNMLFNYAVLDVREDRAKYASYRKRVRKLILEQKKHFHLLSLRNRILVNLIRFAPWLFHIAYGMYVKLFQKEEQH